MENNQTFWGMPHRMGDWMMGDWMGEGMMMGFSVMALMMVLILTLPWIFYILSFQKTALVVNKAGGNAPVESAWALLIPFFNAAWFFVLLIRLRDAIRMTGKEPNDQWWIYGLLAGGLNVLLLASFMHSGLVFIAWLVFAILHWMKLIDLRQSFG